jgi:hypothetical protein
MDTNGSKPKDEGTRIEELFIIQELDSRLANTTKENIQQGAYIRQLENQLSLLASNLAATVKEPDGIQAS